MENLLKNITWDESSEMVELLRTSNLYITALPSGLEADVYKISVRDRSFVLKIWNKDSKPDIRYQYKLLEILYAKGIEVSKPVGWGVNEHNHQVLLMSYDGSPITKINKDKLNELAGMLTVIHEIPLHTIDEMTVQKSDFIPYFYPRIDEHEDIKSLLHQLVGSAEYRPDCIIHGDYNLGNILESDRNKLTIIDWTNAQLGDPRYDIAWSTVLIQIYVGQRYGSLYKAAFLSKGKYSVDEIELFEGIACLRWILLNRFANLPKNKNTIGNVQRILHENKYLHENLLK